VLLASDNLTYLPTPKLTTRKQPFHTKHLPASYISRPYTVESDAVLWRAVEPLVAILAIPDMVMKIRGNGVTRFQYIDVVNESETLQRTRQR
jgi:hypothetical protein